MLVALKENVASVEQVSCRTAEDFLCSGLGYGDRDGEGMGSGVFFLFLGGMQPMFLNFERI